MSTFDYFKRLQQEVAVSGGFKGAPLLVPLSDLCASLSQLSSEVTVEGSCHHSHWQLLCPETAVAAACGLLAAVRADRSRPQIRHLQLTAAGWLDERVMPN